MKIICSICKHEFESNHPKAKYCSDECRYEAWKLYIKKRQKEKYHNDKEFRKKEKERGTKYRKNNRKKVNEYHRRYNKKRRKERLFTDLSKEELEFLTFIAERQQTFKYIRKSKCEVPNCGAIKNLVFHEINYSPLESVTLCAHHHAILHISLLKKKKVKIRINQ